MKEIEELGYTLEEVKKYRKSSDEFQSFCYQALERYKNENESLNRIANAINLKINDILTGARKYKEERKIVKRDREQKKLKAMEQKHNRMINLIKSLVKAKDTNQIIHILEEENIQNEELNVKDFIDYAYELYPINYEDVLRKLKKCFNVYRIYLDELTAEEEIDVPDEVSKDAPKEYDPTLKKEAQDYFYMVMKDEELKNVADLIQKYQHKNYIKYRDVLKAINENGQTLYDIMYSKMLDNRKKYFYKKYADKILKVLPIVDKPIKAMDGYRNFDIVDCYTYFRDDLKNILTTLYYCFPTNTSDDELNRKIVYLKNVLEKNRVKYDNYGYTANFGFFNVSDDHEANVINTIMNTKYNFSKEKGNFLSDENKMRILTSMKENNIPITLQTFEMVINKYNGHDLDLITEETLKDYLTASKGEVRR